MTLRGLIEAVGLALMKAGAWLHRRGNGGHLYERDKATWRFVAGSDPVAILRALEGGEE
jgi:hypothetical protein